MNSKLCVGLDINPDYINLKPFKTLKDFNLSVIDSTKEYTSAYKLNVAFYFALGLEGIHLMYDTIDYIKNTAPDKSLICDFKCGDIENSNERYARAVFDEWEFDAVTTNPFVGLRDLNPFFWYSEKTVYVWLHPSSSVGYYKNNELQDRIIDDINFYNIDNNIGLIISAGSPNLVGHYQDLYPNLPILLPGVTQHYDTIKDMKYDYNNNKVNLNDNVLVNASRSIIYSDDISSTANRYKIIINSIKT